MMWVGPFAYIGAQEILIVAGIIVLIFGGAKIPQLARGMGEGIREFKKSVEGRADNPAPAVSAGTDEKTTTTTTAQ